MINSSSLNSSNEDKIFVTFNIAPYSLINSFIITLTYLIVMYLIKTMIMRVVLGIVMLVLLIIICYGLLGRYYLYKEEKNKVKTKKKSTK